MPIDAADTAAVRAYFCSIGLYMGAEAFDNLPCFEGRISYTGKEIMMAGKDMLYISDCLHKSGIGYRECMKGFDLISSSMLVSFSWPQ
jgi:hypothetical protein